MDVLAALLSFGIIAALTAILWKWYGRWYLLVTPGVALLLVFSVWVADQHGPAGGTPAWLASLILFSANLLIPTLAVFSAARLVDVRHPQTGRVGWIRAGMSLLLFVLLLSLLGAQVILSSIWDVATDGLWGTFLMLTVDVSAVCAAALLAWFLPRWWKLGALAFVVVVMVAISTAGRLGTYDPDGGWGKLPTLVTEARAETITQALERYHKQAGIYPKTLAELKPGYLVYLPTPYIIPGQSWCYESGDDYYRLGYLHRDYFSSPRSLRIHSAAGNIPGDDLECP